MTNKYTEGGVVDSLYRKADVRIQGKTIYILRGSAARGDIGNGSKGKIDYLCRYCGYMVQWVTKFN